MRQADCITHVGGNAKSHEVQTKYQGKRPFWKCMQRWEDNIKLNLREI